MPGARHRSFRLGDTAERLSEFILSSLAFTTAVPRQEDVGYDFFCVLAEQDGTLLKAGPFFTVQAKSKPEPIVYEKTHEIDWIKGQENPFLICVADRETLSMDVYSTWVMHTGFLAKAAEKIIISPGGPDDGYREVETAKDDSKQLIHLGKPILHITAQDAMNSKRVETYAQILREWVLLDRQNVVNKHAGMHWVIGPRAWQTNHAISETGSGLQFFF